MRVRLDEIFDILQTMQLEDLPSDKYIDDSPPSKYQYPFSKLCEMIYGGAYNHFALSMLEDGLGDVIDFENITIDEDLRDSMCSILRDESHKITCPQNWPGVPYTKAPTIGGGFCV